MKQVKLPHARDDQVFLILGCLFDVDETRCPIVIAPDSSRAKRAFVRAFPNAEVMTWPSLKDIKKAARIMEGAREYGVANNFAEVIIDGKWSDGEREK